MPSVTPLIGSEVVLVLPPNEWRSAMYSVPSKEVCGPPALMAITGCSFPLLELEELELELEELELELEKLELEELELELALPVSPLILPEDTLKVTLSKPAPSSRRCIHKV